uniref:Uncharacterized protein n=1 Tax=Lepeophtheirus salmonis TaxID=72036 RepID=A0A0K2V353_LEPSM
MYSDYIVMVVVYSLEGRSKYFILMFQTPIWFSFSAISEEYISRILDNYLLT